MVVVVEAGEVIAKVVALPTLGPAEAEALTPYRSSPQQTLMLLKM